MWIRYSNFINSYDDDHLIDIALEIDHQCLQLQILKIKILIDSVTAEDACVMHIKANFIKTSYYNLILGHQLRGAPNKLKSK